MNGRTGQLSTAAVARAAGMSRRRLNEWIKAGVAVPERPSAKQGSGARWAPSEAGLLRLLVRARTLTSMEALADVARALRRAPDGSAVVARVNGAVQVAPARVPAAVGTAEAALVLIRKASGKAPS